MELFQGGKCRETHSAFRIRTDICRFKPNQLCFNVFSIHIIAVYFFCRLLCCCPWWGYILTLFNTIFLRHSCVSPSYGAHFSTVSVDSYNPTTSWVQRMRVHVKRSFGKRSKEIDDGSQDPSGEWSYERRSIVIGKRGPELFFRESVSLTPNQEIVGRCWLDRDRSV